ncbi:MAG: prepilin peptidase [Eubacteriaceae bacterium]
MDYVIIFIFGLVIGSFLNVCIYRIPMEESIISPPSHCYNCGTRLKPIDLIPVISWWLLGGKCRYCGVKVSYRYALVEFITAFFFVFTYYMIGLQTTLIIYLVLLSILIVDTFIDFDHLIIPDVLNYFTLIIFIILNIILGFMPWREALIGALIGMLPLLLIVILTGGKGMGMGDVKLMAVLGLFLGWKLSLLTILLAFVLGGFFGILLLITKIKSKQDAIPFGPWISIGAFIVMFYGETLLNWYINTLF